MNITLIQNAPKLNRSNIHFVIEQALTCKSDVIVFSELSLNGYLLQDKLIEDAFKVEELGSLIEASKNIDIVVGVALSIDNEYFNC